MAPKKDSRDLHNSPLYGQGAKADTGLPLITRHFSTRKAKIGHENCEQPLPLASVLERSEFRPKVTRLLLGESERGEGRSLRAAARNVPWTRTHNWAPFSRAASSRSWVTAHMVSSAHATIDSTDRTIPSLPTPPAAAFLS
ncbi:hypothetical protein ColTof3_13281 [Colletotrichum tofieldiae]|nr:hypothetical protein ColTof3_13281 [Colletotrichum tofieldiae]